ncbi:DUF1707 SHOCT-like domain-containing protein [Streptomyces sp. 12297]
MSDELPELRASDADRERVVERLREAVAEGRLDMDEFEERMEAAFASRTYAELAPLTRDLPAEGGPHAGPYPGMHAGMPAGMPAGMHAPSVSLRKGRGQGGVDADGRAVNWPARIGGEAGAATAVAVMGAFERTGGWTVPRRMNAVAVWGGGKLDLREARFESHEVVINCVAVMGGIEIIVPPGLEVQVQGIGIMGAFDTRTSPQYTPTDPSAPRVIVTGLAFWGGVEIKYKGAKGVKGVNGVKGIGGG